ncbi:hypothetical protein ACFQ60_10820 [Streptomyces zhihengii]
MAVQGEAEQALRRRGLIPMDPAMAIQALAQAVDAQETCLCVGDTEWPVFAAAFTSVRPSALLSDLPEAADALATTSHDLTSGGPGRSCGSGSWTPRSRSGPRSCWIWCATVPPPYSDTRVRRRWSRAGRSGTWASTP